MCSGIFKSIAGTVTFDTFAVNFDIVLNAIAITPILASLVANCRRAKKEESERRRRMKKKAQEEEKARLEEKENEVRKRTEQEEKKRQRREAQEAAQRRLKLKEEEAKRVRKREEEEKRKLRAQKEANTKRLEELRRKREKEARERRAKATTPPWGSGKMPSSINLKSQLKNIIVADRLTSTARGKIETRVGTASRPVPILTPDEIANEEKKAQKKERIEEKEEKITNPFSHLF